MSTVETAFAKLNLALHVRRRRADGYHDIETLFAFCEDGDRVELLPAGEPLEIIGPFAADLDPGPSNLVRRAGDALRAAFDGNGSYALRLEKNLPIASGIGGGSADAAAALRLLCRLWKLELADPRVQQVAAGLGADVPACLASSLAYGDGRGDALRPLPGDLAGAPVLLVHPGMPLSTAAVFAAWDGQDRGPLDPREPFGGRNDLELPARGLLPVIGELLDFLSRRPGVMLARMSGSGATCFALFESEVARDTAGAAAPQDWWTLASRIR